MVSLVAEDVDPTGSNTGHKGKPADVQLEPDDIVVLALAVEKFKADVTYVHNPEVACFKELLLSWGGLPTAANNTASAPGGAGEGGKTEQEVTKGPVSSDAAPAVMELDSDEEAVPQHKEMELPHGQLQDEFAAETEKPEEDPEMIPPDAGPYPALPPHGNADPSDARKKVLARVKQQANEAAARGDVSQAVAKYTEAIRTGGATALMLATRGALLLKLRRPCAAIRDCCAALVLNPDCGKAYHVRGVAHRKLGHWRRAHRDLSQGQRLDFSEDSVAVHMFVANKVGVLQDQKTGRWYANEGAKKAVELLFTAEGSEKRRKAPSIDLRIGQAVRISGLQKAPQLNGKRGIVQQVNPKDPDRWDVELRLERGRLEVKSIRSTNIIIVRAADAKTWKEEEAVHEEERRRREKEEKRWQEEDERKKRLQSRGSVATSFPDMDISEKLEAEMSCMPLDEEAMGLLRRLKPQEALDVLHQVGITTVGGNLSSFVKIKVRQRLGDPDSDDEAEKKRRADQAAKAAADIAAKVEARVKAQAAAEAVAAKHEREEARKAYNPEDDPADDNAVDSSSDEEDFDHLEAEAEAFPDSGYIEPEPTDEQTASMSRWKNEAVEALEIGDVVKALDRYSKVIAKGGATALMLTKRGELLLKQRRPCAAIKDCTAALAQNPDLGKAYRIRGIAQRKLGRWSEAHHDLVEGQRLDYDEGTAAVQKFVAEKERAAKAKRQRQGSGPDANKRARNR
mmetsp:Transcript_107266/g.268913  ORF Transcript_107266/g.268913 Transcript_107266/m.268913 type:complete len:738 (-) Transcript_107266:122-2335(-)